VILGISLYRFFPILENSKNDEFQLDFHSEHWNTAPLVMGGNPTGAIAFARCVDAADHESIPSPDQACLVGATGIAS
jgi:hypothetical protein